MGDKGEERRRKRERDEKERKKKKKKEMNLDVCQDGLMGDKDLEQHS